MKVGLLFLTVALLLIACRPPDNGVRQGSTSVAEMGESYDIRMALTDEARLGEQVVSVWIEKDGQGVSGAEVNISGDMSHAGMIPVLTEAVEVAPGHYQSSDFVISMAGDWILSADVTLPDGSRELAELRLTVPGRP